MISDNFADDMLAVHEHEEITVYYLKNNFKLKKIYYFTDDGGQHFNNKSSFANLQAHEGFDILAE